MKKMSKNAVVTAKFAVAWNTIAILICLLTQAFQTNTAQAQWSSAHFVDNHPEDIYLLPDEHFIDEQYLTANEWLDRVVTFDLYVGYGNMSSNQNFSFTGCEEWLDELGSLLDSTNLYDYRANWIAYDEGTTWIRVFMIQFTNNLPLGQESNYMSSVGGYVRTTEDNFENFSDYHPRTIHSIDGIRGDVNGDGEVTDADVDSLQLYCFAPWFYDNWRYTAEGVNIGRAMILFSEPTLLDGYLINTWLYNPNDPLIADLGIGELISSTSYGYGGSSAVQPAPYELTVDNNELTVNTNGLAVAIFGNLPDGTTWQSSSWTNNGTADFQLPEGLQNMRIEAVTLESATNISAPIEEPTSFSLEQNYPNPFNPTTTIDFDLAKQAQIKLTIYNMAGQKVATLADGIMPAGHNSVNFDASNLTSGLYFYTLIAGKQVETRKMILQK